MKPHSEPTVFVVDDDRKMLLALRFLLEGEDLQVEPYSSAQAFLDSYDGSAGCLLVDLRMPGMNGLELQELLAARGIQLPIILLVGQGDRLMTLRELDANTLDVIASPRPDTALLKRIHQAIAGHIHSATAD